MATSQQQVPYLRKSSDPTFQKNVYKKFRERIFWTLYDRFLEQNEQLTVLVKQFLHFTESIDLPIVSPSNISDDLMPFMEDVVDKKKVAFICMNAKARYLLARTGPNHKLFVDEALLVVTADGHWTTVNMTIEDEFSQGLFNQVPTSKYKVTVSITSLTGTISVLDVIDNDGPTEVRRRDPKRDIIRSTLLTRISKMIKAAPGINWRSINGDEKRGEGGFNYEEEEEEEEEPYQIHPDAEVRAGPRRRPETLTRQASRYLVGRPSTYSSESLEGEIPRHLKTWIDEKRSKESEDVPQLKFFIN